MTESADTGELIGENIMHLSTTTWVTMWRFSYLNMISLRVDHVCCKLKLIFQSPAAVRRH